MRAFNKLDRSLTKEVQAGLKRAAEPVAASARDKIGKYTGASIGTIAPRAAGASAFVTQKAKKVTSQRGDFGSLQMRKLSEALEEKQGEVVSAVEHELDRLTSGF